MYNGIKIQYDFEQRYNKQNIQTLRIIEIPSLMVS